MYYLDFPGKNLELVLAGAVTTNQLEITVHAFNSIPQDTTNLRRGGVEATNSNNTTDVIIGAGPVLQGWIVNVHSITVHNKDTATATVTVKIDDNGTEKILIKQAVSTGESLVYEDGFGWQVLSPITPPFVDTTAIVKGSTDPTKLVRIEADGLTTATQRVATMPDADIKLAGHATGLTANRIPFATGATGGVLTDSANLTYDGTNLTVSTNIKLGADGSILDSSGNEFLKFSKTASATNEISVTNGDTSNRPTISATGDDASIGLRISPKGTGNVRIDNEILLGTDGAIQDSSGNEFLKFSKTASATTEFTLANGNAGTSPAISVTGDEADINLRLTPKGSGILVTAKGLAWGTGTTTFGLVAKRKTADESVTSSTTLQDDDHLSFSIAANEEWVADFYITCGAALTTTGAKIAITVPSGASMDFHLSGLSAVAVGTTNRTTSSGTGLSIGPATFQQSDFGLLLIHLWVLNGANAGTVNLQFAQDTNSGSALTFRKGSSMTAYRVA